MVEKLHEYQGFTGRLHDLRDELKDRWLKWKEEDSNVTSLQEHHPQLEDDHSHIYRKKSRKELVRVSAAVMGIEFSYAAETAFVSPTLLKIGVEHRHMTLVWALSPLVGFFLTPILGSLSDRCKSNFGRRRPFIVILSIGVFIGLILVPNGEYLGYLTGDQRQENITQDPIVARHRISASSNLDKQLHSNQTNTNSHPWGIFFTIVGTVLLDFDADGCQSPSRAYLLDVTIPEDHARGLSTFTIMAGLGGFFGYALGGVNWDQTTLGYLLGGHVRAVFTLVTIIFIICVSVTITSFKEIPLPLLEKLGGEQNEFVYLTLRRKSSNVEPEENCYGTIDQEKEPKNLDCIPPRNSLHPRPDASFWMYLKSIIYMPKSLRILCLTNLFCWMAHVCYSLYFTDFVGEAVFGGEPTAVDGTKSRDLYEQGVRFGCWGMAMYSLSCACYSAVIERLIDRFRARSVYIGGLLIYSSGMLLMALTKHKVGVIVFSWTAGVMYSTLFTMPYLLIAHYHARGTFEALEENGRVAPQIRGIGTDVALVSSMVFLAQFILSLCMGSIVTSTGTTTSVVAVASALAFCGAIAATQVMYLDL